MDQSANQIYKQGLLCLGQEDSSSLRTSSFMHCMQSWANLAMTTAVVIDQDGENISSKGTRDGQCNLLTIFLSWLRQASNGNIWISDSFYFEHCSQQLLKRKQAGRYQFIWISRNKLFSTYSAYLFPALQFDQSFGTLEQCDYLGWFSDGAPGSELGKANLTYHNYSSTQRRWFPQHHHATAAQTIIPKSKGPWGRPRHCHHWNCVAHW